MGDRRKCVNEPLNLAIFFPKKDYFTSNDI